MSLSLSLSLSHHSLPVCEEEQRRQYVGVRGGSVSVRCRVRAYPPALTFTWALRRTPEGVRERLESVGRTEGLTGRYTLTRLQEERVQVLCWAKNAIGTQIEPCKFTVYTRGRPGPVAGCKVDNHTASGFTVRCRSGAFRSDQANYTLLVYAQVGSNGSCWGD
ncbi:uncharacterized protein LOC121861274 [Homarus americanus]|uniref:uncharacterized protein LOC121861274 n=1 Tax=Homarus americanus TaxID=6706 RepID=UPI001C476EC4|nr:uncharacterized protein LOC121861274 [Homarus americanus]